MNEYLSLANFILPEEMLDWFNLKDVRNTSADGQEVLFHVRRRRWLDTERHNVMTECDFVQESTRCSKEAH